MILIVEEKNDRNSHNSHNSHGFSNNSQTYGRGNHSNYLNRIHLYNEQMLNFNEIKIRAIASLYNRSVCYQNIAKYAAEKSTKLHTQAWYRKNKLIQSLLTSFSGCDFLSSYTYNVNLIAKHLTHSNFNRFMTSSKCRQIQAIACWNPHTPKTNIFALRLM